MNNLWLKPRNISIVVDNDSWILPYASQLTQDLIENGENAKLCRSHDDVLSNGVAFYLGCVKITPKYILDRNFANLVVHASDLPKGRGMSPWTWQILEGYDYIPLCLLYMEEKVDAGSIVYKERIQLTGKELVNDLRRLIGDNTIILCKRFLEEETIPAGHPQQGTATYYKKRGPQDSELDLDKSIREQFDLLRVVDNDKYPAYFKYLGQSYTLKISKKDNNQ